MKRGSKLGATCFLVMAGVLFRTTETTAERAFVTLLYFNSTSNRSVSEQCECGLYGLNSPLLSAQGFVAIPKAASLQACDWNTQFTVTEPPWIALIERGNCTFAEKIKVAARRGATAAVIYNAPAKRSYPIPMSHIGECCAQRWDPILPLSLVPHNRAGGRHLCSWLMVALNEVLEGRKEKHYEIWVSTSVLRNTLLLCSVQPDGWVSEVRTICCFYSKCALEMVAYISKAGGYTWAHKCLQHRYVLCRLQARSCIWGSFPNFCNPFWTAADLSLSCDPWPKFRQKDSNHPLWLQ